MKAKLKLTQDFKFQMIQENNQIWIDENKNEHKLLSYIIIREKDKNVLYGVLSNGLTLPMYELKAKYMKKGSYYIKG